MKCDRVRHLSVCVCVWESRAAHGIIGTESQRRMKEEAKVKISIYKDTWNVLGCAAVWCAVGLSLLSVLS